MVDLAGDVVAVGSEIRLAEWGITVTVPESHSATVKMTAGNLRNRTVVMEMIREEDLRSHLGVMATAVEDLGTPLVVEIGTIEVDFGVIMRVEVVLGNRLMAVTGEAEDLGEGAVEVVFNKDKVLEATIRHPTKKSLLTINLGRVYFNFIVHR